MILLGNILGAVLGLLITVRIFIVNAILLLSGIIVQSLGALITVTMGIVLMLICVVVTLTLTKEQHIIYKEAPLSM